MCGITGKISFTNKRIAESDIVLMNDAIAHRGPDGSGVYVSPDGATGLGHRRLAIIDTSSKGLQPMRYLNRYEIVFNGEIYNFQEERKKLEQLGYTFISGTDTEVILALYDKYKENCVQYLRGMFAFAIYDEQEQILFCARDRVGKKPFKYYVDDNVFMFSSELKAILTQREYIKEPDYFAIHHYLTLQYVPAPLTGFKDIKKLPPAHTLTVDINSKKQEIKKYWHLDFSKKIIQSEADWGSKILEKLEESTRIRMISDVPLGAFLSGGVDSSAIVGLMAKNSATPIKTFSIGFGEEQFNELPYAKKIADLFNTDHTEFIVKPESMDILPELVRQYEEPYADSSALATYYLSKLTREHVTVALNGDGGDENFAGYGRYSVQKFSLLYDYVRWAHTVTAQPIATMLSKSMHTTFFNRLKKFSDSLSENYDHRYVNYICYFDNKEKRKLYTDAFAQKVANSDSYEIVTEKFAEAHTPNKLDQTLYADITTYLPDDLLVKVDIATMSVGLEGRSPFLDQEFMELTAQIPDNLKLKGLNTKKYILKKALSNLLPDDILNRKKMGFGVPIEKWFRGDMHQYVADILLSEKSIARGLFKEESVRALLHSHKDTQINQSHKIWALLTLELWFREYFD